MIRSSPAAQCEAIAPLENKPSPNPPVGAAKKRRRPPNGESRQISGRYRAGRNQNKPRATTDLLRNPSWPAQRRKLFRSLRREILPEGRRDSRIRRAPVDLSPNTIAATRH